LDRQSGGPFEEFRVSTRPKSHRRRRFRDLSWSSDPLQSLVNHLASASWVWRSTLHRWLMRALACRAPILGFLQDGREPSLSARFDPLLGFHAPTECNRSTPPRSPAVASTAAPSMGFTSLRRRQNKESTDPGLSTPGKFRSQVFATSQRLAPP